MGLPLPRVRLARSSCVRARCCSSFCLRSPRSAAPGWSGRASASIGAGCEAGWECSRSGAYGLSPRCSPTPTSAASSPPMAACSSLAASRGEWSPTASGPTATTWRTGPATHPLRVDRPVARSRQRARRAGAGRGRRPPGAHRRPSADHPARVRARAAGPAAGSARPRTRGLARQPRDRAGRPPSRHDVADRPDAGRLRGPATASVPRAPPSTRPGSSPVKRCRLALRHRTVNSWC